MVRRIAAGEVVERPASVLKELIENSIDAASTRIEASIKDGGKSLVEVWDNGVGMTEEEALLAVERHTTSKISSEKDLESIETLGFRGEALYAISSVSMFQLITKAKGEELATRLEIEGGVFKGVSKYFRDVSGTTVAVKNLFFNLRARRRFLRSKRVEQQHTRRIFLEYAMAYPEIEFRYLEEGELIFHFRPSSLEKRVEDARGASIKDVLEGDWVRLFLIDDKKGEMFLYVNRRAVFDRALSQHIKGLLRQRFISSELPTAIVFIDVPFKDVDVNVHPTKREVRFRDPSRIHEDIERMFSPSHGVVLPSEKVPETDFSLAQPAFSYTAQTAFDVVKEPKFRFLGELDRTYLLFEEGGSLIMVDKHALHERLLFERIIERKTKAVASWIPFENVELLEQWGSFLKQLGFEVDAENGVITAVPEWALGIEERVLGSVLDALKDGEPKSLSYEELARIACRAAVKAGDRSTALDAQFVANILEERGLGLTCPHGRPVVVKLDKGYIERLFKRRQ